MDEIRRCLIPFSLILLVSDFERKTNRPQSNCAVPEISMPPTEGIGIS